MSQQGVQFLGEADADWRAPKTGTKQGSPKIQGLTVARARLHAPIRSDLNPFEPEPHVFNCAPEPEPNHSRLKSPQAPSGWLRP